MQRLLSLSETHRRLIVCLHSHQLISDFTYLIVSTFHITVLLITYLLAFYFYVTTSQCLTIGGTRIFGTLPSLFLSSPRLPLEVGPSS